MPPNARHFVFTLKDCMMSGIHFYTHVTLKRAVCGFITTAFAGHITNADHFEFLSVIQSISSFWQPCFEKAEASIMDASNLGEIFCSCDTD